MSNLYLSYHLKVRIISSAEDITAVDFPGIHTPIQQIKQPMRQIKNTRHTPLPVMLNLQYNICTAYTDRNLN